MPFRSIKKLIKKDDERKEYARKPLLDSTPKQPSDETYKLPTLDDLPDMPKPLEEMYGSRSEEYTPHPDVPSHSNEERREDFQQEAPMHQREERQSDWDRRGVMEREPVSMSESPNEIMRKYDDDTQAHNRIVSLLERIEERLIDLDRRMALIERSMHR